MKELEKVKRISIASTLFILAILIGVLTFERPENMYTINTKSTLEKLITNDYLISANEISEPNVVLIDIRSQYEYEKGHLINAFNISSPEILSSENQLFFTELKETNKTMVLYGENPEQANIPFLILRQLGYDNVKLLPINIGYEQNKLTMTEVEIEKPVADIKSFIDESIKKSKSAVTKPTVVPAAQKQVITIQKKKKKPVEGGC